MVELVGGSSWDRQGTGELAIDEAFVNFRASGGSIPIHGDLGRRSMKSGSSFRNGWVIRTPTTTPLPAAVASLLRSPRWPLHTLGW